MNANVTVKIIEHPGEAGERKTAALSHGLQMMLADPDFRAAVEARMNEKKEDKDHDRDRHGAEHAEARAGTV